MGNPTSYRGHNLEWGRIRLLTKWDDTVMEYNANGMRTRKGDTYYELDGDSIIAETTNGNTIRYYYGNGGIVGFRYNGSRYYYEKNLMGDIVAIYDECGNKVGAYTYDAWGNCTITTNINNVANVNPFRYRGYYYDSDLGLYYLKSRYYDAQVCRFINADDVSCLGANEDLCAYNLFTYCGNGPIDRVDIQGNFWGSVWKNILDGAEKVKTAFLLSIEVEVGFGIGIGKSLKAGPYELSICAYDNGYTFGLDDGYTYTANKGKLGADVSVGGVFAVGASTGYEHRYETGLTRVNDGHNAFTMPWVFYHCKETEISNVKGVKIKGIVESNGPSDLTISFGGGTYFILGCDYSVSINVSDFVKFLFE